MMRQFFSKSLFFSIGLVFFTSVAANIQPTVKPAPEVDATASRTTAALEPLDSIIAVVDKQLVLMSEYEREYERILSLIVANNSPLPSNEVLKRQVGEHLILNKLQLERADKMGIIIDDNQLNDQLARIAAEHQKTLEQLRHSIEKDGLSFAAYREAMRTELRLKQVRQRAVLGSLAVSDREVEDFLSQHPIGNEKAQYKLRHIVLNVAAQANSKQYQAAKQKMQKIRDLALAGSDFATLATEYSDAANKQQGGDLGWLSREQVPSLYLRSLDSLNDGEVSPLIEAAGGVYLFLKEESLGEKKRIVQQVKLRHILLKPDIVTSEQQILQQALRLRQKIVAGESFATLAKTYSQDPGSAVEGGVIDWTTADVFVPEFSLVANTLAVHTLSQPVKTEYGWHLIEVLGRREHDETAEYRQRIAYNILLEQKAKEAEHRWLQSLRDAAHIEYYWQQIKPQTTQVKVKDATYLSDREAEFLLSDKQRKKLERAPQKRR